MAKITKERLEQVRAFIAQYSTLETRGVTTLSDWIQLKFSCSKVVADRLIHAAETNITTEDLRTKKGRYELSQRRPTSGQTAKTNDDGGRS